MQDQYAGDIGDFGKFYLLRYLQHLNKGVKNTLGIVWYRHPSEEHLNDGRHTEYLDNSAFLTCDTVLTEKLSSVVEGERSIDSLTLHLESYFESKVKYFNDSIIPLNEAEPRKQYRESWLDKAVESLRGSDIIFLDPDNGLAPNKKSKSDKNAGKFAFIDEVSKFTEIAKIVVLYQHADRTKGGFLEAKIPALEQRIKEKLGNGFKVHTVAFRCRSTRAYFVISRNEDSDQIRKKINQMLEGNCAFMWQEGCGASMREAHKNSMRNTSVYNGTKEVGCDFVEVIENTKDKDLLPPYRSPYIDCHRILLAEEGFSIFSIYAKHIGISKKESLAMINQVNSKGTPKTFTPNFPLTLFPRSLMRDFLENEYKKSDWPFIHGIEGLEESLSRLDSKDLSSGRLFVDLRTSTDPIPKQYIEELVRFFRSNAQALRLNKVFICA